MKPIVQRIADMINHYWVATGRNPGGIILCNSDYAELRDHCNRGLPAGARYEPTRFYGIPIAAPRPTDKPQHPPEGSAWVEYKLDWSHD